MFRQISNSTIGNNNNSLAGNTLNVGGGGTFGSSISATNGIFSGYVTGDEFRGNNTTVDIHRNGTSNGIRISGSGSRGLCLMGLHTAQIIYSSTFYNPFSDERLKENVVDLTLGLDEVNALRPKTFDWKDCLI